MNHAGGLPSTQAWLALQGMRGIEISNIISCFQALFLSAFGQIDDNSVTTTLSPVEQVFTPSVSATCRAGIMTIKVETPNRFLGVVHARDFRRPACTSYGLGTSETPLNINMLAEKNSDDYCGVFINKVMTVIFEDADLAFRPLRDTIRLSKIDNPFWTREQASPIKTFSTTSHLLKVWKLSFA